VRILRHKLLSRLPYDGQGLRRPDDARLAALRSWAARLYRQRLPPGLRPLMPLTRLAFALVTVQRTAAFARRGGVDVRDRRTLLLDCLASGAQPVEAFAWRACFASRHPLPARAAGLLLWSLGDPAAHRLLLDKQATGAMLQRAGLATPAIHAVIERGSAPDPSLPVWTRPGALFIKPRRGAGGRGSYTATIGDKGLGASIARHIAFLASDDDLLVQDRIAAAPELADLATSGRPPVLRVAVARAVAGKPFVHAASLSIQVPRENPRDFLRGQLRAPVEPTTGQLGAGLSFREAGRRVERLPWNDAPLAGRTLEVWPAASAIVLRAMELVPDLPLVAWDIIPAAEGPVILEGNTGGDWILTCLGAGGTDLVGLLQEWQEVQVSQRSRIQRSATVATLDE
jgi:hypothetical protein